MHSANFTALSRALRLSAALPPAWPEPAPVLGSEGAFEPQPVPISATVARAASGHRLLLMPRVPVTAAVPARDRAPTGAAGLARCRSPARGRTRACAATPAT